MGNKSTHKLATGNKDLRYIDVIDLICQFSDQLELIVNEPSIDFMHLRMDYLEEEMQELREAMIQEDHTEIIDGAMDVAFIAIAQAYHLFRMLGHRHIAAVTETRSALLEVARTNMMKNPPTEAGKKITKPEGWKAPNFEHLINPPQNNDELKQNRG